MSSKTLALALLPGRLRGAVLESSISAMHVATLLDAPRDGTPVAGGPFDRVVAAVGARDAVARVLALPFGDRRRVGQAVGPALEEHVPLSLDDAQLAWDAAAPASSDASSVLAVLAGHPALASLREELASLARGTAASHLWWAPALVAAVYRKSMPTGTSFVAVDLGDDGATIASFEGEALRALRMVAPCEDPLFVRNVAWTLATLPATPRVVLGGRHAERLRPALAARLGAASLESLPAEPPVDGLSHGEWRHDTLVAGLVLAATGEAPSPLPDLAGTAAGLLAGLPLPELQREARPLLRWGAAAAVLGLLAVGVDYVQLFAERRALEARCEQAWSSVMPSPSGGVGRKLKMEMRLGELGAKASGGQPGSSPLALLAALSRDVPRGLDVVVDEVEQSPPLARVAGHAPSYESVTQLQESLRKGGSFARVDVKDVHAAVSGNGAEFQMELSTLPAGGRP